MHSTYINCVAVRVINVHHSMCMYIIVHTHAEHIHAGITSLLFACTHVHTVMCSCVSEHIHVQTCMMMLHVQVYSCHSLVMCCAVTVIHDRGHSHHYIQ